MKTSELAVLGVLAGVAFSGCTASTPETEAPSTLVVEETTTIGPGPRVLGAELPTGAPSAYGLVEITVELEAEYVNPYDRREVSLDAVFRGPDDAILHLPGFWDGEGSWRLRFTPSAPGEWEYEIMVRDDRALGAPLSGTITVADSEHPGFLRPGDQVDPSYSPRYFAFEDGTPWYGRGHADLDMSLGGPSPDGDGLRKFTEMPEAGENYEMWWPMWGNNFIQTSYDDYSPAQAGIIDFVVQDAERKDIALVFTVWGHQFLRTAEHDWPDDRWNFNGFSELTDIEGFYTDPEAWAWQENLYRYILARWSYSPTILMWQTVTEINGTESYEHTDTWHEKVNAYFQEHDPYRHPTTATKSGAEDWPEGHAVMDVPQVHLYHIFGDNPLADGAHFAEWTRLMWERAEKPNWIGEYGNRVQSLYPEFMHFANWAALSAGAAMTPTEWNDRNAFGAFDDAMKEDMRHFADFVETVPLVTYDPETVTVSSSDPAVRGWGIAGQDGGVVWVQDFALEGDTIDQIRADETIRSDVVVTIDPLVAGTWTVRPYDTWRGEWLESMTVECDGGPCDFALPSFDSDLALHIEG